MRRNKTRDTNILFSPVDCCVCGKVATTRLTVSVDCVAIAMLPSLAVDVGHDMIPEKANRLMQRSWHECIWSNDKELLQQEAYCNVFERRIEWAGIVAGFWLVHTF